VPIYDYVCRSCGHVLEVMHGVHQVGPSVCPVCGGEMRKALTAAAVVYKGSGWAKKDARTSAKPAAPAKPSGDAAKPAGAAGSEAGSGSSEAGSSAGERSAKPAADSTGSAGQSPSSEAS